MCGISGFFNISSSNFKVNTNLLDLMQQKLAHRGPDLFGFWHSDLHQIGFAHSRLSIIDLSPAGKQPMFDKELTVAVMFNGEIYNHLELRAELEKLGYKYFSNSDTESIIYAYKEWGIDFLHKLDGMFAIALFDLQKNEFFLVRDRIGVKPLYFSLRGGILSFASEIKALFVLPWIKKEVNQKAFYDYLTFMVSPAPQTIFNQIFKLPAASYLHVDEKKHISFHEWYSPLKTLSNSEKKEFEDENFCLERIEELLIKSVKKRMITDVPIGAFLSGGIDSSLIVALMSQISGKVKTFTVAFDDDPENNELHWANLIAKKFDTQHQEIIISEKDAFNFYEKMVYHLDEPLADCVCIPFYYVSKLAKDNGVTVALVGEGADELFFGYSTYASYKKFYEKYWRSTNFLPKFIKTGLYKSAKTFLPAKVNHLEILKNWAYERNLFWGGAVAFNEHQKNLILNKNIFSEKFDSFDMVNYYLSELKKADPNADFVKQMTYVELKNRLPELLLMRADKMSMAASVEARVPFLDYRLVEFMLNVPAHIKFKNNQTKYLLKKIAEKYLPHEVIYRKKVGFSAPTYKWFNDGEHFKKMFSDISQNSNFFVPAAKNLESLYKHHESGFAVQKWTLQNFLMHKKIFDL